MAAHKIRKTNTNTNNARDAHILKYDFIKEKRGWEEESDPLLNLNFLVREVGPGGGGGGGEKTFDKYFWMKLNILFARLFQNYS